MGGEVGVQVGERVGEKRPTPTCQNSDKHRGFGPKSGGVGVPRFFLVSRGRLLVDRGRLLNNKGRLLISRGRLLISRGRLLSFPNFT